MRRNPRTILALGAALTILVTACGGTSGGSASASGTATPAQTIVLAFAPSAESGKILLSGDAIASALSRSTGLKFKAIVPTSYAAVVEGMCAGQVDVAFLPPLSFVLAKDKGCAQLGLVSIRNGSPTYRGQIRVRIDSGIQTLADLRGKRFAFVDPLSTSGSMYPQLLIKKQFDTTPQQFFGTGNIVYAGSHDRAMIALYQRQVDGAASFIDVASDVPLSAVKSLPDIATQTKRIAETEDIPGDTFSFRSALPAELKVILKQALRDFAATAEGKQALLGLYSVEGLTELPETAYDAIREAAKIVGINLEVEAAKTPKPVTPATTPPATTPAATKAP